MKLAVEQSINSNIYIEHNYQGNLSEMQFNQVNAIDWVNWFQTWLEFLSKNTEIPQDCELSLSLTSDRHIQAYNYQYRSLDQPTDVLAFAITEAEINLPVDFKEPVYLGDIIISLDTAIKQAQEQNHSLRIELAWLSSHGLLHLLGWDHPDDQSLERMLTKQREMLQTINIINPN